MRSGFGKDIAEPTSGIISQVKGEQSILLPVERVIFSC